MTKLEICAIEDANLGQTGFSVGKLPDGGYHSG